MMNFKKIGALSLAMVLGAGAYSLFDNREKILEKFSSEPAVIIPSDEQIDLAPILPKEETLEDFLLTESDLNGKFVFKDKYSFSEDGMSAQFPNPLKLRSDGGKIKLSTIIPNAPLSFSFSLDNLGIVFYDRPSSKNIDGAPSLVQLVSKFENFQMISQLQNIPLDTIYDQDAGFIFQKNDFFSVLFCPGQREVVPKTKGEGYELRVNTAIVKDYLDVAKGYSQRADEVFVFGNKFGKFTPAEFAQQVDIFQNKYLTK